MSNDSLWNEVQVAYNNLNNGILNPDNAPDHLSASSFNNMGHLSMRLDATVKGLSSDSDLRGALSIIHDIQQEAKRIIG